MDIRELLEAVSSGELSTDRAYEKLKTLPFEEIGGFACLDNHRKIRTGFPEVVFCQSKPIDRCAEIFKHLYSANGLVLGTRASLEQYKEGLPYVRQGQRIYRLPRKRL